MEVDDLNPLPSYAGALSPDVDPTLMAEAVGDNMDWTSEVFTSISGPGNGSLPTDKSPTRDRDLAKVEIAVLSIMFTVTVIGNSLVLLALGLRRKKLTRMYYFIFHLCISDLVVAFFHILPQLCWEITTRFRGNNFLCKLVTYLQLLGPYLSSYILVMTAIDRYLAICFPLSNSPWTVRQSRLMIGGAWFVSLLFSVPQLFVFSYVLVPPDYVVYNCYATFLLPYGEPIYITWFAISVTLCPLLVLVYTYTRICWTVWVNFKGKKEAPLADINTRHSPLSPNLKNGPSSQPPTLACGSTYRFRGTGKVEVTSLSGSHSRDSRAPINPRIHSMHGISRAKIKTVKLTVVVIACYIVCSTPFSCVMLLACWDFSRTYSAFYSGAVYKLLTRLASLNSCVNPWVYLAFNDNLLESLRDYLCCCCRCGEGDRHRKQLATNFSRTSLCDSTGVTKATNGEVTSGSGLHRHTRHTAQDSPRVRPTSTGDLAHDFVDERTHKLLFSAPSPNQGNSSGQRAVSEPTSRTRFSLVGPYLPGTVRRDSLSSPNLFACSSQHGDSGLEIDGSNCECISITQDSECSCAKV